MTWLTAARPDDLIRLLWLAWIVPWWGFAVWSSKTVGSPGLGRQVWFRVLVVAGAVLLFGLRARDGAIRLVWWQPTFTQSLPFLVVAALGFAFTWWARFTLGRLWSSGVTRKAGHHVVNTGPYGIVRHPIYTGLFASAIATAAVPLTPLTILGAALIVAGFYTKARVEERFLRAELGAPYGDYATRVPMLVPFSRR